MTCVTSYPCGRRDEWDSHRHAGHDTVRSWAPRKNPIGCGRAITC